MKWYLDFGHGGKDSGAVGTYNTKESDVVLNVCECFVCVYIQAPQTHSAHGSQEKALDPLELEGQTVVSCPVGSRN